MQITALNTRLVEVPFPQPITTAIHDMRSKRVSCIGSKTLRYSADPAYLSHLGYLEPPADLSLQATAIHGLRKLGFRNIAQTFSHYSGTSTG